MRASNGTARRRRQATGDPLALTREASLADLINELAHTVDELDRLPASRARSGTTLIGRKQVQAVTAVILRASDFLDDLKFRTGHSG